MNDFEEYKTLKEEQHLLMERIQVKKEEFTSVKGVSWDKTPNTKRELDPTLKHVLFVDELERELLDIYQERQALKDKIIERLEPFETIERRILKEYYLFGASVSDISIMLSVTSGDIYRTKRQAIEKYEKMYHC